MLLLLLIQSRMVLMSTIRGRHWMALVRRHRRRGTTTYEWRPVTVQNDRRPGIWSRAANAANAANDRDDDLDVCDLCLSV